MSGDGTEERFIGGIGSLPDTDEVSTIEFPELSESSGVAGSSGLTSEMASCVTSGATLPSPRDGSLEAPFPAPQDRETYTHSVMVGREIDRILGEK